MKNSIMEYRNEKIRNILKTHDLGAVLFCNGALYRWDSWLTGSEAIPILAPFGRLNLFLETAQAELICRCAYTNHPCDFPHYQLFDCSEFPELFGGRIGIVNPEGLLKITRDQILECYPGTEFVDLTMDFRKARAVKCDAELEALKEAAEIYDHAVTAAAEWIRPGMYERDTAVELRSWLQKNGGGVYMLEEDPNATTALHICSAPQGERTESGALRYPGHLYRKGDRVNLRMNGYLDVGGCGAIGRCFTIGKADGETAACWQRTVKMQQEIAEWIRPGRSLASLAEMITRGAEDERNGFRWGKNCVFGIGCARSEAPQCMDETRDMEIREGMALVIAPSLYPEGQEPYCCMDMFRVSAEGCVRLSASSQEMIEV